MLLIYQEKTLCDITDCQLAPSRDQRSEHRHPEYLEYPDYQEYQEYLEYQEYRKKEVVCN